MSRGKEQVLWFTAGALIGAGVALLVAPKSGAELRGLIGETAGEGRERLLQTGRDLFERGRDIYARGKQIAEDAADLFEEGREMLDKEVAG